MIKTIFCALAFCTCLNADMVDYIYYVPSDLYSVKNFKSDAKGVTVEIHDWYHNTDDFYYCSYDNSWCYPKFYPSLAVMYGQKVEK